MRFFLGIAAVAVGAALAPAMAFAGTVLDQPVVATSSAADQAGDFESCATAAVDPQESLVDGGAIFTYALVEQCVQVTDISESLPASAVAPSAPSKG